MSEEDPSQRILDSYALILPVTAPITNNFKLLEANHNLQTLKKMDLTLRIISKSPCVVTVPPFETSLWSCRGLAAGPGSGLRVPAHCPGLSLPRMAPCAEPGPRTPLCIVPFLPLLRQGVDVTCPGDWGGPGVTCPGLVPFTRWEKQVLPFNSREKRRGHGHSALGRGPSLSCSTLHVLASLLSGCVRAPSPASSASIPCSRRSLTF